MSIKSKLAIVFFTLFGLLGAPVAAVAQGTTQVPVEATWPTIITDGGATATIYEPQPTSWPGRTTVNATAAMMIDKAGSKPIVGTVDISAATQTDFTGRWVTFSDIQVLATHFPMLDTDQAARVQARITTIAAKLGGRRVPLDTLLLALDETQAATKPVAVNNTPPVIFHSTLPAVLVVTDGAPVLAPISGTGLSFAVNTNWSLLQKTATGRWYLLDNKTWLSAPDFTGPYEPAGVLPADFGKLPDNASFADLKKYVPNGPAPNPPPTVFVSTKPAQIIVTNGPAQLTQVAGAPLKFVSNSSAEVIFDPSGNSYYVLFSGRWFSAPSLDGPWVYATPTLPPTFALIPADGPHGAVLASVPGTAQAQEAVISAQIPRQATLPRTTTTQVTYVGAPNFVPIAGTDLTYAVNTYSQVVAVNGTYYACNNGAWFVSNTPSGPWQLAASVPQAIYTIPPSSPLYPVTYVHVYSATPTAIVTGYTAGYTMGLIAAGVVVYGTGYYYPPVVIAGALPIYLPYPYTYGGGIRYVSATGAWVSGGAVYGPYGGVAASSAYNPATGAYAHGSAVWGPNGGSAYGSFSNPSTGRYGSTSQSWNPYGRSGSSTFSGPNQTVHTQSGSNANGSAGGFKSSNGAYGGGVYNKSNGNTTAAGKAANGDVYAGHNGNVYQHSDSGWSKYDNSSGGFKPVAPSSTYNKPANGASQASSGQARSQAQSTANRSQGTSRPSSDDFGQLNSDRSARQGGWQRQSGGGRQFGGGGFSRGGFSGGGGRRR